MRISFTPSAINKYKALSIPQRMDQVAAQIQKARSPEEAIQVSLQLGVIHGLEARAAQMYLITQTPALTSVKTVKVYKWLKESTAERMRRSNLILKEPLVEGNRVLAELDPDSAEVSRFAEKMPLSETEDMRHVFETMRPLVISNPEQKAHLRDRKPFILFPVMISPNTCAVFKLKFEKGTNFGRKLPDLKRLFSFLSNRLFQIESLFGRRTESYKLRIRKETLTGENLVGISILAGPVRKQVRSKELISIIERVNHAQQSGVDLLHLDVMDGLFNQGLQMVGPVTSQEDPHEHFMVLANFLNYLRPRTQLPIDVHLMVQDPISYIVELIKIGVDLITISAEKNAQASKPRKDLPHLLASLHKYDVHVGLALNPGTPLVRIMPFLGLVDVVTVMSVVPGASGQKFMPEVLSKIEELRAFARAAELDLGIQDDGGINLQNVKEVRSRGANIVTAASALYQKPNLSKIVKRLKES